MSPQEAIANTVDKFYRTGVRDSTNRYLCQKDPEVLFTQVYLVFQINYPPSDPASLTTRDQAYDAFMRGWQAGQAKKVS